MQFTTGKAEAAWLAAGSLLMLAVAIPAGTLVFMAAGARLASFVLAGFVALYFGGGQFLLSRGRRDAFPGDWALILLLNTAFLLIPLVALAVRAWIAAPYLFAAAAAALLCSCAGALIAGLVARFPSRR